VQLPARAKTGKLANIAFRDLTRLAQSFGFVLMRTTGSHRIFRHPRAGTIPLQPDRNGDTKPYRVRQLIALAEEFKLTVEKDAG
jgi:predicted RNA binding protein YcfA (HicA-like mRNA interferase family)